MFQKILIAEDQQSTGMSVKRIVNELHISISDYAYYCDDAMTRISNEKRAGEPYELLITDLSFDPGDREQRFRSGTDLIAAARREQPDLKILVFSVEKKPMIIKRLLDELKIDGYVSKGRKDEVELHTAVEIIARGGRYTPDWLRGMVNKANLHPFNDFDRAVIRLLMEGINKKEIPPYLERQGITPTSLSSIEKRLILIRNIYNFKTDLQLAVFCQKEGII
jgi:two-component system capsular synthesis response regulator RcsB